MDDERFYELAKEAAMLARANLNANGYMPPFQSIDRAAADRMESLLREIRIRELAPRKV